jgi:hypothetical protein
MTIELVPYSMVAGDVAVTTRVAALMTSEPATYVTVV